MTNWGEEKRGQKRLEGKRREEWRGLGWVEVVSAKQAGTQHNK